MFGDAAADLVLVQNASVATNTAPRNLVWELPVDGKGGDVAVYFSTGYGAVKKLLESLKETHGVGMHEVEVEYPIDDEELLRRFQEALKKLKGEGKKVRAAVFDTVSSMPGVRMPWEKLCQLCMVDAAHGVGHIAMDITGADPDFLVTNLHKWVNLSLYVF